MDHKALCVINMLNDFIEEGAPMEVPAGRWIIENIRGEIRYAREKGRPIFYICDRHEPDDPEFEVWPVHALRGTRGAEFIDALTPQPGDYLIETNGTSGFFHTDLARLLEEHEIDELLLCGVMTNVAVLYTAADAIQRNIGVIVPETCVAARTEDDHRFALRQIREVLANPATHCP